LSEEQHPEIVIVKRHARHTDEHHGGAWKIAFADFMTAMMALFLVLWLISSTSDKQRRAVAQYFNPVKLVDMTTLKKGFHDPKDTEMGSGNMTDATLPDKVTSESPQRPRKPAADPTKDESAPAPPLRADSPEGGDEKARDIRAPKGQGKGERRTQIGRRAEPLPADLSFAYADPFATVPDEQGAAEEAEPLDVETRLPDPSSGRPLPPADIPQPERSRSPAQRAARSEADKPIKVSAPIPATPSGADLEALASEIHANAASDTNPRAAPRVEVRVTDDGVLISLTDALDDTMFSIGSAEPHRKTIEAMQRIARSLATRPGEIVIRGHTDARPYRSGTSDNWRLSSARALAARDVLVRGGLAENRIERVEGYADRNPRVAADPTAPENRRIEILLRKGRG
jgi:chemotaxis protein MotB